MTKSAVPTVDAPALTADELLLQAGKTLFATCGYAAVTTRDIAREAGVNLGLIQYHFGSKANLFLAVVRHLMKDCAGNAAVQHLVPAPTSPRTARVAIARFIRAFLGCLLGRAAPEGCQLMYREALDEGNPPGLRRELVQLVSIEFTRPVLDRVIEALRPLRPDLPDRALESVAHSILGQCSYYLSNRPFLEALWRDDLAEAEVIDRIAQQVTAFSLGGLGSLKRNP